MSFQEDLISFYRWIAWLPVLAGIYLIRYLDRDSTLMFVLSIIWLVPLAVSDELNAAWGFQYFRLLPAIEVLILYHLISYKLQTGFSSKLINITWILFYVVYVALILNGGSDVYSFIATTLEFCIFVFWIARFVIEQYHLNAPDIGINRPFYWYVMALMINFPALGLMQLVPALTDIRQPGTMKVWLIFQTLTSVLVNLLITVGFLLNKTPVSIHHETERRQLNSTL